jgi:hypothetical protein
MVGDPAVAGQTREKGRLLGGREWNYEPFAAIKFHVRIRGASCVGFFSCHIDLSFLLGSEDDHLADFTEFLSVGTAAGVHPSSCHLRVGETLIRDGLNYPFGLAAPGSSHTGAR